MIILLSEYVRFDYVGKIMGFVNYAIATYLLHSIKGPSISNGMFDSVVYLPSKKQQ